MELPDRLLRHSAMTLRQKTLRRVFGLFSIPVVLVVAGCGSTATVGGAPTSLTSDASRVSMALLDAPALGEVVAAADEMGLDLVREGGEATTVTSPASLQVALSMAAEGAEGQTLKELETLLGASGKDRSDAFNALTGTLVDLDGDPAVVKSDELPESPMLHRANGLVLDDDFSANPDFVDTLAESYGAPAVTVNLGSDEGIEVLDAWADKHTGGLVPKSAIEPDPTLALVLQDAIVMAAPWESPFAAALTTPADFTLADGESVRVDMMDTVRERPTLYAEAQDWQVVRLPYAGGRLCADVILPPMGASPIDLRPDLLEELTEAVGDSQSQSVIIRMPIVEVKSKMDLLPYLGEKAPASLGGGFGPMGSEALSISQAWQQGVLKVNEEGTVAAVLTEIGFGESAGDPRTITFEVDRPYLVRIADAETEWPLFYAHIADPRKDE